MGPVVQNVAVDCADAYAPARFWSEALGRPLHPEGNEFCVPRSAAERAAMSEWLILGRYRWGTLRFRYSRTESATGRSGSRPGARPEAGRPLRPSRRRPRRCGRSPGTCRSRGP
nr:VOC family protein [Streptomyces sp. H51]